MPRPVHFWCVSAISWIGLLICVNSSAETRDGIHKWRDNHGILNITNLPTYPKKRASSHRTATVFIPKHSKVSAWTAARTASYAVETLRPGLSSRPLSLSAYRSPMRSSASSRSNLYSYSSLYGHPSLANRENIYVYIEDSGIRHFTNLPIGNQRYTLVTRARYPKHTGSSHIPSVPRRSAYDSIVAEAAQAYQVDKALVRAVIHAESAFNPVAVSPKGATGLMQLMPDTARRYGVQDIFDPSENIRGGVRYLRDLLDMFNNDLSLAVAAYNAGENAVARYGGIPPYADDRHVRAKN